jgi:hypothetical protein
MVLDRDDNECRLCGGSEGGIHVHHRRKRTEGGSDDPTNLISLCLGCHLHHHASRVHPEDVEAELEEANISTTPADLRILAAVEVIGPASSGDIATEAGISYEHARRRLYALGAAEVVGRDLDRHWDLTGRVEQSARGRLPDTPARAARLGRDAVIDRLVSCGFSVGTVAAITGLDERTIPVASNRARTLDPPVLPSSGDTSDLQTGHHQSES